VNEENFVVNAVLKAALELPTPADTPKKEKCVSPGTLSTVS
jgi:hypothetical protein